MDLKIGCVKLSNKKWNNKRKQKNKQGPWKWHNRALEKGEQKTQKCVFKSKAWKSSKSWEGQHTRIKSVEVYSQIQTKEEFTQHIMTKSKITPKNSKRWELYPIKGLSLRLPADSLRNWWRSGESGMVESRKGWPILPSNSAGPAEQCLTETSSKNHVKEQVKLRAGEYERIMEIKAERNEVETKSVENQENNFFKR